MTLGMSQAAVEVSTGTKEGMSLERRNFDTDVGAIGQEPPRGVSKLLVVLMRQ